MRRRPIHMLMIGGLATTILFSGCASLDVDPEPKPVFPIPDAYAAAPANDHTLPTPWWTGFDDPALDALVEEVLSGNLTLAQGQKRMERAAAFLRQAKALRKPTVDLQGGLRREWERIVHQEDPPSPSFEDMIVEAINEQQGGGGGGGDESESDQELDRDSWVTSYDIGAMLQWELDFWGRLRNAARAEAERYWATTLDYESLRLTISAQVVEAYYQAIEQRLQLALLEEQLESAENFLELIELRFLQGTASSVDLLQQEGQVAEIKAEMPVARAQLGLLENRLDVLTGLPPDGPPVANASTRTLPETKTLAGIGVPATLLAQRPDLLAAQRRVVASDYDVAVAVAERLPRITLDGSLVLNATTDMATLSGLSGLGLFQPLLDWGRRHAVQEAARATFEEELLAFSDVYLNAIEEVETTLWQETQQRELVKALAHREEILQRTLEQSRLRYSQGVTDYLPVLTAQQDLQEVQRELLLQKRVLVSLRVQLFRAAGAPTRSQDPETATQDAPMDSHD